MKKTRLLMGMPVTIETVDQKDDDSKINLAFSYFEYINQKFSPYDPKSELSRFNRGEIKEKDFSPDMKTVFYLSNNTKLATGGYFDIKRNGRYNTCGLVKGWAIFNASQILKQKGLNNFYIEAGGDIQACGTNHKNKFWKVGIRHPKNWKQIIKILSISNRGVATSGTYFRGQHIYNPKSNKTINSHLLSLTVIGPNIYEADRFATAAFAMGDKGIKFIENLPEFEGYSIEKDGVATYTSGFDKFLQLS